VLIGFIDHDGDVILAADGKTADTIGRRSRDDEWKIARRAVNAAIGFSGFPYYGNQVLAQVMRRRDLLENGDSIRIVRELEKDKTPLSRTTMEEVKREMDEILGGLSRLHAEETRKRENVLPLRAVFIGGVVEEKGQVLVWAKKTGWRGVEIPADEPAITGPDGSGHLYDKAAAILLCSAGTVADRVSKAAGLYADEFGDKVNRNVTMRRGSNDFDLECLY